MTKTTILEENSFFVTHRYRRQLLLRIHLAQLRQSSSLKKGCDIISESMCNVTKSGACRNGERNMDMMTETSITMCLAILETLGPTRKFSLHFIEIIILFNIAISFDLSHV